METGKYIKIKNLKELYEARSDLGVQMGEKAKELDERYANLKECCSPDNIIRTAIRRTTSHINWVPVALAIIRTVKSKLQ